MNKRILPIIIGWSVFAISLVVYILTLEPTTSFWDCSEFISCADKLEVGHAPGAPIFMLLGRFFAIFAGGDSTKVAFMVNTVSALASAFTIFFLYWTLVWFIKKWMSKSNLDYSPSVQNLVLYGSAVVGALSFAFTDTFWFSAVEGEVYATSSFFTAISFWAITKWEESADEKGNTRWIILIFYLLGISVGVHLLNVLTIPAIALVFYYKKFKPSAKGILLAFALSFIIILLLIFGIIPGVVSTAAYFDLFFVNSIGLPVYVGAFIFLAILTLVLFFAYKKSLTKKRIILKIIVLSFTMWMIGYSSFAMLVIRSASNPFVDMNNVQNLFGLVNYLNREQYPQRPLIYGNNYNSPVIDVKERYTYKLYNDKYYKDKLNPEYIFDKNTLTFFPRMASLEPGHADAYQNWVKIKGRSVDVQQHDGTYKSIIVPTFSDNFVFFIRYQLGYMYFRYLMWNFSGRQNDIQGHGGVVNGNWITGIPAIDKVLVGPDDESLDTRDQKKSRSVYFMLPLLLGLFGLAMQYRNDKDNFLVIFMLFLFTGIAIAVYLNEIPSTPRERDYAFVGSFYAFSMWIGLGCFALIESLKVLRKNVIAASAVLLLLFLSVPMLLLYQNYSCHDRSGRYTTRDYAKDILESCDKDAILFTTADNDTYPIWYAQEVEGVRTDIREILEPFIPVDWYADQFNQKFEGKKDLKFDYRGSELLMDNNQYFPVIEKIDSAIDLTKAIEFIRSDDPRAMIQANDDNSYHFLPSKTISFKVNKDNFIKSCSYAKIDKSLIPDRIEFKISAKNLSRDQLFVLDLIARNNWEKPIYFISTNLLEQLGLGDYVYPEGLVYRFSPFKNGMPSELARLQAMHQYELLKTKFKWGNVNSKSVYLDQMNVQMVSMLHFREMFATVAKMLVFANEKDKALEILKLAETIFPKERIPYSIDISEIVDAYYVAGDTVKANQMAADIGKYCDTKLAYYNKLNEYFNDNVTNSDAGMFLYTIQLLTKVAEKHNSPLKGELAGIFNKYYIK